MLLEVTMNALQTVSATIHPRNPLVALIQISAGSRAFHRTHWMDCPKDMLALADSVSEIDGVEAFTAYLPRQCTLEKSECAQWEKILPHVTKLVEDYLTTQ